MSLPVLKDPTRIKQAWEVLNQLCENQHLLPSQDWLRVDEARKVVADWYVRLVSGAVAALLTLLLVVPAAAVPIADPPEYPWGIPISALVPMTIFPTITVLAPVYELPLELPAGVSLGSPSWNSAEPAEPLAHTPEPGTLLLVGSILTALGLRIRRRR